MVVGAVALVATGAGAIMGAAWAASTTIAGVSIATIATVASATAAVLSLAVGLTTKRPTAQATGSPTQFSADPDAGIPLVVGRTGTAGNIVFRRGFDTRDAGDNDRQAFVSVLSLGPVAGIDSFTSDKSPVTFSAGAAVGAFAGFMWMMTQLGATPEAAAMTFGSGAGTPFGWTAAHKISGKAAATWTLRFDTKGKMFQAGVPAPMWVVRGAKCYDPRKDSTYPGGSGPHRMADPSNTAAYDAATDTWEFTEDPYLLGLRWAHGYWQRDRSDATSKYQRVMGMGAPWAMIDVPAFVEGANIAGVNGWKAGGVIFSGDDKWASMKKLLQAGMGEPLALGARVSCLINAPKVSLATITKDDLAGKASVSATQPRRNRLNTITPRYRLEMNNWQLLPAAPISVPEYVAVDRGKRSKTQDYPFIQDTKQVAVAARYDIENGREFGPITLPLKLLWMGYKPGDCVTVTLPEVGLNGQDVLLLNRDLEPATGVVTLTARSETAAKHPYALGQITTPPPTPGVTGPLLVPTPGVADWALTALPLSPGVVTPTLVISGAVKPNVDGVVFEYREFGSGGAWTNAGSDVPSVTRREIVSVKSNTQYEVAVSYVRSGVPGDRLILGPVTAASVSVAGAGVFTLLASDSNVVVTPTSVTKTGGGTAWNGGAYSLEKYVGDVMVTGRVVGVSNHQFIGLNADNSLGSGLADIDYAAYNRAGNFDAWINGVGIATSGTVAEGAVLYVRRRGAKVEFGVLGESAPRYTHASGIDPTIAIGADISLYEVGAKVDSITLQPIGSDGAAGANAVTGLLTNEAQQLPADAAGNVTSYAGANGSFQIFSGTADVSGNFTLATVANPQALTVSYSGRTYTVTAGLDAGEPTAQLTIRATGSGAFAGVTIDKVFSLSKSVPGAGGASGVSPPLISIAASPMAIAYDQTDAIASGDVTIATVRQNTTITPSFGIYRADGTGITSPATAATLVSTYPTAFATSGVDNLTLKQSWLSGVIASYGSGIRVVATAGAATDMVSLVKVKDGANGTNGAPGLNNASVLIYQRAAAAPTLPNAAVTYTFANGAISGLTNGWSAAPPTGTNPLYVSTATASASGATDTIAAGEWASPVVMAQNGTNGTNGSNGATGAAGANGINSKALFIYQRAASAPLLPSAAATYTFSTQALTGLNNGWQTSIPAGTLPIYVSTASALSATDTDTIGAGEWAAAAILAQNGANGTNGTNGSNGAPGANGTDAYLLDGSTLGVNFAATYDGVLKPGQISQTAKFNYTVGGVNVSGSTIWSLTSANCSAAIAADGTVSFTAITANGYVEATGTYGGVTRVKRIPTAFVKDSAPPNTSQRQSVSLPGGMGLSSSSYPSTTPVVVTIAANSSGQINAIINLTWNVDGYTGGTKQVNGAVKAAYRIAGSSSGWADFSTGERIGGSSVWTPIDKDPGGIAVTLTQSGLSVGQAYDIGLFMRVDAANTSPGVGGSVTGSFTGSSA